MEQLAATMQDMHNEIQSLKISNVQLQAAVNEGGQAAAGRTNRVNAKVMEFRNGPDDDWLAFKSHFDKIIHLNQFTDYEARLALASAMRGRAATNTLDIDVKGNDVTLLEIIERYEERFLPAGASQRARTNFDRAQQKPEEDVLDFHSRLRSLWNRAYPQEVSETQLIRRFILGIRNKDIREEIIRRKPETYGAALAAAQDETSIVELLQSTELGAGTAEAMDISALKISQGRGSNSAPKRTGPCHMCDSETHWKDECPELKKAMRLLGVASGKKVQYNTRTQPKAPNRNPTGRGRFTTRRKQQLLAALQEFLDDEEEPEEEPEDQPQEEEEEQPEDF